MLYEVMRMLGVAGPNHVILMVPQPPLEPGRTIMYSSKLLHYSYAEYNTIYHGHTQ